jgi:hypothetical protein
MYQMMPATNLTDEEIQNLDIHRHKFYNCWGWATYEITKQLKDWQPSECRVTSIKKLKSTVIASLKKICKLTLWTPEELGECSNKRLAKLILKLNNKIGNEITQYIIIAMRVGIPSRTDDCHFIKYSSVTGVWSMKSGAKGPLVRLDNITPNEPKPWSNASPNQHLTCGDNIQTETLFYKEPTNYVLCKKFSIS